MVGTYTPTQKKAILKYQKNNKEKIKVSIKKHRQELKLTVIKYYSQNTIKCMCKGCNISMIEFLTIDHIEKGGNSHRKEIHRKSGISFYRWLIKNNFPEGFQVLCFNCNIAKSNNNNKCPHLP